VHGAFSVAGAGGVLALLTLLVGGPIVPAESAPEPPVESPHGRPEPPIEGDRGRPEPSVESDHGRP
jgi:hypothetical protein